MIGQTLGSYSIKRELGKGGMGAVYLGVHTLLGRAAAVKVLLPHLTDKQELVRRFFNEAKAATAIKHPGIVEIYDFGYSAGGSAFIVMEFLEGESLATRLKRFGRVSPAFVLAVARQVASTLAVTHKAGIVHRDLKPENVFLVPDSEIALGERVKLLDFGIAKLAHDSSTGMHLTASGAILGTPYYMSPEQCRGAGKVDARSDLYALGCMMYEMLAGRVPFVGEGVGDIIAGHLLVAPSPLRPLAPEVSAEFEALVMRLLAKSPADRPKDAEDTAAQLVALGGLEPRSQALFKPPWSPGTTDKTEEKGSLLDEIADLEKAAVDSDDSVVLQKLLDMYTETKQWVKVVSIIERFIALETDAIRMGTYYLAAGTIARDELKASDEAIDFYNKSLDSFFFDPLKLPKAYLPRALKAFADIDKIVTAKRDWKRKERSYRDMIKRLPRPGDGGANEEAFFKLRVDLLDALGEIYRSRLNHFKSSIQAFETAQELDPVNKDRAEILAELYMREGADYADQAVGLHMKILRDEPFKYESYKALYSIYKDAHQYDKTWCVCATLAFLKKAEPEQLQFYEQYKPHGLVKARSIMTPESWSKLVHPNENRHVSEILKEVWSGVAVFKAYPHKEMNIRRKDRRALATDQLMFSKLFYYVAQVLGVPIPEMFLVEDDAPVGVQLANFAEKRELCPAFVVRPSLLQGKTEHEIAFLLARHLTFMRPEYYLKLLLPTIAELKAAFLSAIHVVRRDVPLPPDVAAMVSQQYAPEIQKRLNPAMYEQLAAAVQRFIQAAPKVDLTTWGHAVDGASHRAGLVVCGGDLMVASRMVSSEPVDVGGLQAKDKITELVLYSVTEEYFAVRQQTGITIG